MEVTHINFLSSNKIINPIILNFFQIDTKKEADCCTEILQDVREGGKSYSSP